MKKSLLIAMFLGIVLLHAKAQNSNSDISAPVVIDTQNPLAQVLSPNGGEAFNITLPLLVTWAASDDHLGALPVKIGFSTAENGMPIWLENDFPNTGQIELLPPQEATTFARVFVKLTDTFGNETTDESDGYFTLAGCQPISVWAGDNVTICEENAYFNDQAVAQNYNYANWQTIDGSGYFSDENAINTTYYPSPGDYLLGCIRLVLEVSSAEPCPGFASDTMIMCFQPKPFANAGENATICQGNTLTLSGSATNYGNISWATSGTGTFSSTSSLTPIYTPSAADINAGSVTLTLTASAIAPCPTAAISSITLTIQKTPTANAGTDATICQGSTHTLAGSAANYWSLAWTTSGNGTFSSTSSLTPVYTPSVADITAGSVTLTLTASAIAPCPTAAISSKVLTIQKTPTANAGENATICQGSTYTLAGTAANYGSIAWATSGTGTFSSTSSLTPVYTPSVADITAGSVTLTLTASAILPCTTSAISSKTLTIQKTPTANAGINANICQGNTHTLAGTATNQASVAWTTSGNGTFSSTSSLTPVYTPSVADITAGSVTLTLTASAIAPCPTAAISSKVLTIQKTPTANAGENAAICQGNTHTLSGSATNYGNISWTTSGTGIFSSTSSLTPIYTPSAADINAGAVTLTLTASAIAPCPTAAVSSKVLTIQKTPTANAGADASICQGSTHTLAGTATNHGSVLWSTSGTGTFSNTTILNPVYTPSAADINAGTVTLTLTASTIAPCTTAASGSKIIIIQKTPTANAGENAAICQGSTCTLAGTAAYYGSIAWTTSGNGTFSSTSSLTPVYTPSVADITAGSVTLTLTASAITPCTTATSSSKVLTIQKTPTANAGTNTTICQGTTHTLAGTATNQGSVAWTTSGNGTFSSTISLTAIYTPSAADINAGNVTLTLTASAILPCTNSAISSKVLTIQKIPTANAGDNTTICQGTTHTLAGTATNQGSVAWTTSGNGTFSSTSSLTPIYTPGAADITAGAVTLTLTASAIAPCTTSAISSKVLTIQKTPTANAGENTTICQGTTHPLAGTAANQGSVSWTTSGNGTFSSTSSLTPIYTPGAADITAGAVTLTLTASAILPCTNSAISSKVLTIQKIPTANAGENAIICQGSTHTLAGTATNQGSVAWTTSGNGTFSSISSLTAIYTPSAADITAGNVTLTLTASAILPCTNSAISSKILTIQKIPTANAGENAIICQGTTHTLAGTATNQGSVAWTTSGNGTFSSTSSLTPIYTPSAADINAGSVTLTLTASAIAPCPTAAISSKVLTIQKTPTANAGTDASVCQGSTHTLAGAATNQSSVTWTTSGNGTFSSTTIPNPVYTPGTLDISSGTVSLTLTANAISPCITSVSDAKILQIQQQPVINFENPEAICASEILNIVANCQYVSNLSWTTVGGDGQFIASGLISPGVYYANYLPGPSDINAGFVTLKAMAAGINPCGTIQNSVTINIQKAPTASAGEDAIICSSFNYQCNAEATNYLALFWSTTGDGNFDNYNLLNPVYTPGPADIALGSVTLTLTAEPITPCEFSAVDEMILQISPQPFVDILPDQVTICYGEYFDFTGLVEAGNYDGIQWFTINGSGMFSNEYNLEPIYYPNPDYDYSLGCIEIGIQVSPVGVCIIGAEDFMTLCFQAPPTANAGSDAVICQGNAIQLNGEVNNSTGFSWSTAGDGTFDNTIILNPVYTPGSADIALANVNLTLSASPFGPCEDPVSDVLTLQIQKLPSAFAGVDDTICDNSNYQLSGVVLNYGSLSWSTSGDGIFNNSGILNPIYTPGFNDISAGMVTLKLTATAMAPCTGSIEDDMTLYFQRNPYANVSPGGIVCEGDVLYLDGMANSNCGFFWASTGSGFFGDPQSLNTTYTPSEMDFDMGNITIICNAMACEPCNMLAMSFMQVQLFKTPVISAGDDAIICENQSHELHGTFSTTVNQLTWTTSGDGFFSSPNSLNTLYTPGMNDLAAGEAILTITANSYACWTPVSDSMSLQITSPPVINAGADATVSNNGSYYLADAQVTDYINLTWTTTGDGTFDDNFAVNPTYTPGILDLLNGFVVLKLEAMPLPPCMWIGNDQIQLNYTPLVTNVAVAQRTDGSKMVDINFDLVYEEPLFYISAEVSFDGEQTFQPLTSITGDAGNAVQPGAGKHIVWDAGADASNTTNETSIFRITAKGSALNWPTCPGQPTVTDIDGNTYNTVLIGTQCWLKENLKTGTRIASTGEQTNNATIEKYCYDNDDSNCNTFGGLYQWDEMMQYTTSGLQGICPLGWQLPSDDEWTTLTNYLGDETSAGGKLKEFGISHWNFPNTGGTNSSGFTALPAGFCNSNGFFYQKSNIANFWSSSESDGSNAWHRELFSGDSSIYRDNFTKSSGFSVRCVKFDESQAAIPTVTTAEITNISNTYVTSGGNVTDAGANIVTARGVCWSTSQNPTIADSKTTDGSGIGTFMSSVIGLTANTAYFLRAYATNITGTAYGNEVSFTTLNIQCPASFTDSRDGKVYSAVLIGTQCWMKQNLNVGTRIAGATNQTNNATIEKYCYNNTETNCTTYGGLYQWNEMMLYTTTPILQGICPTGWHLPSDTEWTSLTTYLGGASVAGGKMKEAGTSHWIAPNTGATNSSGFTALPAGYRGLGGGFGYLGEVTFFWSSAEYQGSTAWIRYFDYGTIEVNKGSNDKTDGFSVRCIKNDSQKFLPTVTTTAISNIATIIATSGGNIINDGSSAVNARGICWSTSQNPSIANNKTVNSNGIGPFISLMTGLTPNTTYYVRAYATNSVGTAYGSQLSFTTLAMSCPASFTDSRDGKVYTTVLIGNQCWMKQNLNIGTRIAGESTQTNNGTIEKYCFLNSENLCTTYGGLYQWNEMMQYSTTEGVKGICPTGWHLPTDSEWTTLTTFLGGEYVAGGKMKKTGTTYWNIPNQGATNSSGFTGLPAGSRISNGTFSYTSRDHGILWSSTEYSATNTWLRELVFYDDDVNRRNWLSKGNGFSVRCLRD
jgi:uncharacterized protein (TIGR02145 family)